LDKIGLLISLLLKWIYNQKVQKGNPTKQKLTWPRSNSARTHPADHISIDVVYSVAPNISSGAR
jgi:hypothetical protein